MNLFALATFAEIAFSEIHAAGSPESKLAAEREGGIRRSVSLLQKMNPTARSLLVGAALLAVIWAAPSAMAQPSPSGPPVVGVIKVERRPMTDSYEFNGRIVAINSVNIIARLTAFLDQQLFTEGTDVKKGDPLYTLERPPFQAAVDVQEAAVAQAKAQLENSNIELWRKQELLEKMLVPSRPSTARKQPSASRRRSCNQHRHSSNAHRSILAIPRSTRRSMAASGVHR